MRKADIHQMENQLTAIAIDTSTDWLSVALRHNGSIFEQTVHAPRKHAELLPHFFAQVIDAAQIELTDVTAFVYSAGPGSYTGLRVGLGFLHGICAVRAVPIAPVDSLLGFAAAHKRCDVPVAVATDARAGGFYFGIFDFSKLKPQVLQPSNIENLDFVAQKINDFKKLVVLTDVAQKLAPILMDEFEILENRSPQASALFELVHPEDFQNALDVEIRYMRNFLPTARKNPHGWAQGKKET